MRRGKRVGFRRGLALLLVLCVVFPLMGTATASEPAAYTGGLCQHHTEHTADCGYVGECACPADDAGEKVHDENCALSPCTFQCPVCPIEEKISQLSPEQITQDTGTVAAQAALAEIDAAVAALPEGLALTESAAEALTALKTQVQAVNQRIAEAVKTDIAAIPTTIDAANKDSASALVANIAAAIDKVGRETLTTAGVNFASHDAAMEALKNLDETSQTPPEEPTYYCKIEEHTHSAENGCYAEDGATLICELTEHTHTEQCKAGADQTEENQEQGTALTQEEQAQVDQVAALIEALPTMEALEQALAVYDKAGDVDGYDKHLSEAIAQTRAAYAAYSALTEAQQQAVTNVDKLMALQLLWDGVTLDTPGALTSDAARVSVIEVKSIVDGTDPFDGDDEPGNDSSDSNKIVRTFDTVTYQFEVQMESYGNSSYSEARVKLEFVLPLTSDQAVFDQSAMAWMDQTSGYAPVLTTENREIDGETVACQVLTCYKHLLPSEGNDSVVPGTFGENLTISVRSMKNGDTFSPIISAAMEHGTWNGACAEHGKTEKATVMPDKVTVTAAPKYNIKIGGQSAYKSDFDFNSGNSIAQEYDDAYGIGTVTGRVSKYGVTIQLYNDDPNKGFKGIELPHGDITFDLKVSSLYTVNNPNGTEHNQGDKIDITDTYTPLLWSADANMPTSAGSANSDGRVLYDTHGFAEKYAPYADPVYPYNEETVSCYQSGSWRGSQKGNIIHVTISNYEVNMDWMPSQNANAGQVCYGEDLGIGVFSAGEIWIVQPYNNTGDTGANQGPDFDVVKEYGEGSFTTTVEVINMSATSVGGTEKKDPDGTNDAQMNQTDDSVNLTLELVLRGRLQNRVAYQDITNFEAGVGVSNTRDGLDFATIGTSFRILGGFTYIHQNEESNLLYWGTNLTKFYGSAIELMDSQPTTVYSDGANPKDHTVYYATKKDGTDWASDDELQHTYEDDLVFYKRLSEIPSGHLCVGILFCFKEDTYGSVGEPFFSQLQSAKVRDNMDLANNTYMLASTSRVWTKGMFEAAGMTLDQIPDWSDPETTLSSFPTNHYKSANIEGSTWYTKETYAEDGSGAKGTHNSDWRHWGDTLLVIGYKTGITKSLSQVDLNKNEKNTYNLDAEQRVVDFKLQPRTYYDQEGSNPNLTTTVTIVDTLPRYLKYRPGSAYFGGTYKQDSIHGGTQGTVTGGTLQEPSVKNNDDGTQTLTWTITDVTVGAQMPAIYYSADIGNRNDPDEDVPTGTTQIINAVRITATHDIRVASAANGNYAEKGLSTTRGTANSFGKYSAEPLVEPDGNIDYVVYFDNNSATNSEVVLLDAMPYNGENGSHFNGTYTVTSWKLDVNKCTAANLKVYYTTDTQYKGATTESLGGNVAATEIIQSWTPASISSDGTVIDMNGKKPVAWAILGTLGSNQRIEISMRIDLEPEQSTTTGGDIQNNYYVNTVSSNETAIRAETGTVNRSLEGLAWVDKNADGIQDGDEARMSGVRVELLKLKDGGDPATESDYVPFCYMGTETPVVIETGQQVSVRAGSVSEATNYALGRYKFDDLPAGTYAVRFSDGTKIISGMIASPADQGSNDAIDSDGIATYSDDHALQNAVIRNIVMPTAEKMSVLKYESKNHDLGLFEPVEFTFTKVHQAQGNKAPLSGAKFALYANDAGDYTALLDTENLPTGWTQVGQTVTSGNDGNVSFTHLLPGTYRLVETQAPAGYIAPSGQWNVTLASDAAPVIIGIGDSQPPAFISRPDGSLALPNMQIVDFPESGGIGHFTYGVLGCLMIGGGALMLLSGLLSPAPAHGRRHRRKGGAGRR